MALSTQYRLPIPKGLALLSMWFLGAQGPFTQASSASSQVGLE